MAPQKLAVRGFLAALVLFWPFLLGAKPPEDGPVSRVDRMWAVGEPALDAEPKPGIYAWISNGKLAFAVAPVGDGRRRVYQWTVRSTQPLTLADSGDCKVAAKNELGLVLAARPARVVARCAVATEGEVTLSRFRVGRRAADAFVGPLAVPAARQVRIGRY